MVRRVGRIEADCLPILHRRLVELALLLQNRAEVDVVRRVCRIQANRFAGLRRRLVELALVTQQVAEAAVRV